MIFAIAVLGVTATLSTRDGAKKLAPTPLVPADRDEIALAIAEFSRGELDALKRRFLRFHESDRDPSDALFSIWEAGQRARVAGDFRGARGIADLVEELVAGSRVRPFFALLAQSERLEISLALGNIDVAASERDRLRELAGDLHEDAGETRWARAFAETEEVNYALAADDFDGAAVLAKNLLERSSADPAIRSLRPGILTKHGLALVGQARRKPELLTAARDSLRETLFAPEFTDPGERVRLGAMLIGLDLRVGALDAAGTILDGIRSDADSNPNAVSQVQRILLETVAVRVAVARHAPREELSADRDRLLREFDGAIASITESGRNRETGFLHFSHMIEALCELINAALVLDGPRAAFDIVMAIDRFARLARNRDGQAPSIEELVADGLVSDRHALLCLIPGTERAHLFLVTRDGVEHYQRPDTATLKRAWQRIDPYLHRPLRKRDRERLSEVARDAADVILGSDVLARLRELDAISIHAPAGTGDLPFEHLAPHGVPLAHSHAIDRWPSLSLAVDLARRAPTPLRVTDLPPGFVLEIAAPILDEETRRRFPSTGPLPYSDAELLATTAAYPPSSVDRRWGVRANVGAFLERSDARILTILAHGVWVNELARPAAIALAPSAVDTPSDHSGLLTAETIESTTPPWLVLLGVCSAGAGPRRLGNESALDLGGAFLFAGAGAIMLANGRVEAESTQALLARVHRGLASGFSPAEALRRARLEIDRDESERESSHPLPFVLLGAGQRPLLQ